MKSNDELMEIIETLVNQFAYRSSKGLNTGGLSALEIGFETLGWDDPHFDKFYICQIDGCKEPHTCGTPTPDGYKLVCVEHFRNKLIESTEGLKPIRL